MSASWLDRVVAEIRNPWTVQRTADEDTVYLTVSTTGLMFDAYQMDEASFEVVPYDVLTRLEDPDGIFFESEDDLVAWVRQVMEDTVVRNKMSYESGDIVELLPLEEES